MFNSEQSASLLFAAYRLFELVFHNTVRSVRKGHRDAVFAILSNIVQTLVMVGAFYLFIDLMGMRGLAIRGDFLLYVMSGIFVFMVNIKAMAAVASSEGPTSPMMQHLPMNTTVSVWAAALSSLYTQLVGMIVILTAYHLLWTPLEIDRPVAAFMVLLLAWFNGCAIGMVLLSIKPWMPRATGVMQQIYSRFNMFASGKMFVANALPSYLFAIFAFNPLFHIIDQGRGFMFINYNPLKTSISFPLTVSLVLLVIGMIGENYTRQRVSLSWQAGR